MARPVSASAEASATAMPRTARPLMLVRCMRIGSLTEADAEQHRSPTRRRDSLEFSDLFVREIFHVQKEIRAVRDRMRHAQPQLGEWIENDLEVSQRALTILSQIRTLVIGEQIQLAA